VTTNTTSAHIGTSAVDMPVYRRRGRRCTPAYSALHCTYVPPYFCLYLRQILTDFNHSFTGTLCGQFVICGRHSCANKAFMFQLFVLRCTRCHSPIFCVVNVNSILSLNPYAPSFLFLPLLRLLKFPPNRFSKFFHWHTH